MTISSGFFNSVSGDRKYNARHFNEIFDGMLKDGVYTTIGDQFNVTAGSGMQVIVGTGRGWFKNTWIYNDAPVPFNITSADPVYKRIDAIVIDVDTGTQVRNDDIKYIMGTAASTPDKPTLIDTPTHKQYPLAWIMVNAGVTAISSGNITDCKLTGEIPAVEAILEYSSRTKAEIDERFERDEKPSFTESQTEDNIASGESIFIIFGKIQKFINIIKGKLPVKFGGTGKNTFTENSVLLGNAANAVKEKTSNTGAFYSDGPGQEPVFGTLPVDKGGTGATTAAQALTNLGVPSDVSKAMSKDVYCSQDTNRVLIDLAHGGTGTNNGTINGVRLMKIGSTMGYYDANGTFKSFRQPTGTATAAQVLSGYTFANASSDAVSGSMANRGAVSVRLTGRQTSYTVPSGYHDGNGLVSVLARYVVLQANTSDIIWAADENGFAIKVKVSPQQHSGTYTPSSNGTALDMGAVHNNRYVNTQNVYNQGFNNKVPNMQFSTDLLSPSSSAGYTYTTPSAGCYLIVVVCQTKSLKSATTGVSGGATALGSGYMNGTQANGAYCAWGAYKATAANQSLAFSTDILSSNIARVFRFY